MRTLTLALCLLATIAIAESAKKKKPTLLNLDKQISDDLRQQQRKTKDAEKEAGKKAALVDPNKKKGSLPCDPSHGDCIRNHPELIPEEGMPLAPFQN